MLFNSIEFAIFLPVVFLIYWFGVNNNLKHQNLFLLFASYTFYSWWDWRFLLLLAGISFMNYFIGLNIGNSIHQKKKKLWLAAGLIINICILGVFKYYNFFIDSFIDFFSLLGYDLPRSTTRIILPLGISFYIFLSLSYILDIYKENLKAEKNIVNVLLTLSFFPIILAGPIQRPSSLIPQISRKRVFQYNLAADGLRQILWGLFVKTVVADNLAPHSDNIFKNYSDFSGGTLLLGALYYTIQVYADFSGYSNIAIGVGKLFGFNLMQNFAYPYFSRDITLFWKRWHISLTTWFRDYLFLPISFAVSGKLRKDKVGFLPADLFIYIVASLITWFLTGLWHGANYTFIIWGMIHGFFLIVYQWQKAPRKRYFKKIGLSNNNIIIVAVETIITLTIVVFTWIIFRSDNLSNSWEYIHKLISSPSGYVSPELPRTGILTSVVFLFIEFLQRNKQHALETGSLKCGILRWSIYTGLIFIILFFGGGAQKFIYFQF